MAPPLMHTCMVDAESQFPVMVYSYTTPEVTQVGPVIFTWLKMLFDTKNSSAKIEVVLIDFFIIKTYLASPQTFPIKPGGNGLLLILYSRDTLIVVLYGFDDVQILVLYPFQS